MKGNRKRWIFLFSILFLFTLNLLFSQSEEAQKILENNKSGIIALMAYDENQTLIAEGSGFAVEKGIIATNYHLVSKAVSVEGRNFKGKKIKVEGILAFNKDFDLALLKIKGKAPSLSFGNSDEIKKDQKIFAMGSNESKEIKISEGTVRDLLDLTDNQRAMDATFPIPDTFSGGPLLDSKGQIVGILIFPERGLKFGITSNLLKTLQKKSVTKFKNWQGEEYFEKLEGAFLAGRASAFLDELGKARKYLLRVTSQKPDNIEAHILLASINMKQRDYSSAASEYNKIIELDPTRDKAHLGIGMVYLKMRKWKEALAPLEKAIQLNLDNKEAYFHLGNAYEELEEFEKAAKSYENYLSSQPENPELVYYHIGLCRVRLEQFENAIKAFQEAKKIKPQDYKINYQLAKAYHEAKQHEKAEEIYMFLSELFPEDSGTYLRTILKMYDDAGNKEKAIEIAIKIAELNPNDETSFTNLGLMYLKQDKYTEAMEAFNRVISINPGNDFAFYYMGFCNSKMKKYTAAIKAYKKLVELVPDHVDGWFNIGISYMLLKDWDSALQPLRKTVELRPDHGNALYNLAITYLNLKDNYSAKEIYNKLTTLNPGLAQKLRKYIK